MCVQDVLQLFFLMIRQPPRTKRTVTILPFPTLFRAYALGAAAVEEIVDVGAAPGAGNLAVDRAQVEAEGAGLVLIDVHRELRSVVASDRARSEEHTSELPSLMRISYAVFSMEKSNNIHICATRMLHMSQTTSYLKNSTA